jgi:hypothetical protein
MAAGTYNITLEQGATFAVQLLWQDENATPINLTGFTAEMQIRKSSKADIALITLTDTAGLTLGGSAGTIDVLISASETAALPSDFIGVYDLEINSGSEIIRLIEGQVVVNAEVTK